MYSNTTIQQPIARQVKQFSQGTFQQTFQGKQLRYLATVWSQLRRRGTAPQPYQNYFPSISKARGNTQCLKCTKKGLILQRCKLLYFNQFNERFLVIFKHCATGKDSLYPAPLNLSRYYKALNSISMPRLCKNFLTVRVSRIVDMTFENDYSKFKKSRKSSKLTQKCSFNRYISRNSSVECYSICF